MKLIEVGGGLDQPLSYNIHRREWYGQRCFDPIGKTDRG